VACINKRIHVLQIININGPPIGPYVPDSSTGAGGTGGACTGYATYLKEDTLKDVIKTICHSPCGAQFGPDTSGIVVPMEKMMRVAN
jgi:hypothetical protein